MLSGYGRIRIKTEFAEILAKALQPDDIGWAKAVCEKDALVLEVNTPKLGAMINAFDDFFLNLKAVLSVLELDELKDWRNLKYGGQR